MSKKHKKKARSAKVKPHTVKEANRRKRLRENTKAKRASTKVKQCSKHERDNTGTGMKEVKDVSSASENPTGQQKSKK